MHARMVTALADLDAGLDFREGHELDDKTARRVPKASIGNCSPKQAQALLKRLKQLPLVESSEVGAAGTRHRPHHSGHNSLISNFIF